MRPTFRRAATKTSHKIAIPLETHWTTSQTTLTRHNNNSAPPTKTNLSFTGWQESERLALRTHIPVPVQMSWLKIHRNVSCHSPSRTPLESSGKLDSFLRNFKPSQHSQPTKAFHHSSSDTSSHPTLEWPGLNLGF